MKKLLIATIIIVVLESLCIYAMKQGKKTNCTEVCTLGIGGFLLVGFMFNYALEQGQIGSMAIILEALTILSAFIMGYMYFEEEWNWRKSLAIVLSFAAIAIIYFEESREHSIIKSK